MAINRLCVVPLVGRTRFSSTKTIFDQTVDRDQSGSHADLVGLSTNWPLLYAVLVLRHKRPCANRSENYAIYDAEALGHATRFRSTANGLRPSQVCIVDASARSPTSSMRSASRFTVVVPIQIAVMVRRSVVT
jgi:hypothetical protein